MEAIEIMQDFIDRSHDVRRRAGRGIHVADTANLARVVRLAACLGRDLTEISDIQDELKKAWVQIEALKAGRDPGV